MEAGEYALTRGTWFFARCLEVVAVAGLLWISWCVLGGASYFLIFFFRFFFSLRTHTACCKYEAASCLIYISTSTGVRTGCPYLIILSVCSSVCVSVIVCAAFVVCSDRESCTRPISTNPVSMEAGEYGLTRGTWVLARRLEVVAVAGLLWIAWFVLGGAIFSLFFR